MFSPAAHQVAPGQSVSTIIAATITDTAGESTTLSSTVNATALAEPIVITAPSTLPATETDFAAKPLSGFIANDPNPATLSAIVTIANPGLGSLSDPNSQTDGGVITGGQFRISGSTAVVDQALDNLVYLPSAQQTAPGTVNTNTLSVSLQDTDGSTASLTTNIETITQAQDVIDLGSGPDTITLLVANSGVTAGASFTVVVDGTQIGTTQTVTASSRNDQYQEYEVSGNFGTGAQKLSVNYTGPSSGQLQVDSIESSGQSILSGPVTASINQPVSATFQESGPAPTVVGHGSDCLDLTMSERSAPAGAEFTVSVDGSQIGGVQVVQANILQSQNQVFDLLGNFGSGQHTVDITYLNAANSLLFVESTQIDGLNVTDGNVVLSNNGTLGFNFNEPDSSAPAVVGSGPDTLSLFLSQRAEPTGAQFTIDVDGKQIGGTQTVNANVLSSESQQIDVEGNFGPGSHTLSLNYLNANDSLLFLDSAAINGNTIAGGDFVMSNNGSLGLTFATPGAPPPVEIGSGPDTLTFHASATFSQGNPQFIISLDGKQISGPQSTTAINGDGQSQVFQIEGNFSGQHSLGINLINGNSSDATGPSPTLYIGGISIDGVSSSSSAVVNSNIGATLSFSH